MTDILLFITILAGEMDVFDQNLTLNAVDVAFVNKTLATKSSFRIQSSAFSPT